MSGGLRTLHQQRRAAMDAAIRRHREIKNRRAHLVSRVDDYLGSPRSLAQAFVAGFMTDQARPGAAAGFWLLTYPLVAGKRWLAGSIMRTLMLFRTVLQRFDR